MLSKRNEYYYGNNDGWNNNQNNDNQYQPDNYGYSDSGYPAYQGAAEYTGESAGYDGYNTQTDYYSPNPNNWENNGSYLPDNTGYSNTDWGYNSGYNNDYSGNAGYPAYDSQGYSSYQNTEANSGAYQNNFNYGYNTGLDTGDFGYEGKKERKSWFKKKNKSSQPYARSRLNIKKIAAAAVVIAILAGAGGGGYWYWDTNMRDKSAVYVCESQTSYNKGVGTTFYVGKDGKTIEVIENVNTVTLDFISNNMDVDEESSKKILEEYKENLRDSFRKSQDKYKDYSWLSGTIEETDSSIKVVYAFDVADEAFDYSAYQADKDLSKQFPLEYYWNEEEGKFIYNESKILGTDNPLSQIENVKSVRTASSAEDISSYRQQLKTKNQLVQQPDDSKEKEAENTEENTESEE